MLRHRLQQGVCSRASQLHYPTPSSRSIFISSSTRDYTPRAWPFPSRLLLKPGTNQLPGDTSTQNSHEKYFSTSRPRSLGVYKSSSRPEKFSTGEDTPGPKWRKERNRFEARDGKGESPQRRYRNTSPTRGTRRPREDLGGHLYDNYKPRPSTRGVKPQEAQSQSRVDMSPDLEQAIRTVFPHVEKPTPIQARLIPAIMQGHDVILIDETGSGKTFGSVLALLPEIGRPHTGITTLYIVPHRDLAYQIESWCQKLVAAQPSTAVDPSTVVRVIARPNTTHQTFADIRKNPPRILISTPGALMDAMQMGSLRLDATLRRIVIDEVDAVMKIPPRYRHVQLRNTHTPETAQVIDKLLQLMWEDRRSKPQMVMMSATLKTHVRSWLFKQKGWMAERVVRLHGIHEKLESGEFEPSERTQITHSAVVVEADGRLRNLDDEQSQQDGPKTEEKERGILSEDPEAVLELLDEEGDGESNLIGNGFDPPPQTTTRLFKGSTLPPSVLEAIATSVALDVSHRALLVIPTGVSVDPVVEALRGFGVEARTLNFQEEIEHVSTRLEELEAVPNSSLPNTPPTITSDHRSLVEQDGKEFVSNPTLLVATTTAVRGVDIPTLSHVYIVGGLESEDVYRHIAGRAGRFGMPGTVISFVSADSAERLLGGTGERRLRRTFRRIGVHNTPFSHI